MTEFYEFAIDNKYLKLFFSIIVSNMKLIRSYFNINKRIYKMIYFYRDRLRLLKYSIRVIIVKKMCTNFTT